jgi:starch-binding outer membrane protein SusE/F
MRYKIFSFIISAMIAGVLITGAGCKKTYNYSLDQTVSPVSTLIAPQDSLFLKLNPASGPEVTFEWAPALAADGSLVQYEIAYDSTADFKHPVFQVASDNTGVNTQATVSQSTLNSIAKMAGIANLDTGKIYWTVYSTKGLNLVKSSQTYMMTVVRPAGFDSIPNAVYLTGSATEGGAALATAIPFNVDSDGVFDLYTSLKSGSYQFVNSTTGTPVTFFVDGPNLKSGGSDNYTDTTAQVRINLDFNNAVASITVIRSVDVWFAAYNDVEYHLNYAGNSIWADSNQVVTEMLESYGLDDRYKFRYTVNYGGGVPDTYEWYGSVNSNNNEPTPPTPASYFYLVPVTNDEWNNCYKFITATENGLPNNIIVYLQPNSPYTHSVTPQ